MFRVLPDSASFTVHGVGERLTVLTDAGMTQEESLECLSQAPLPFSWDIQRASWHSALAYRRLHPLDLIPDLPVKLCVSYPFGQTAHHQTRADFRRAAEIAHGAKSELEDRSGSRRLFCDAFQMELKLPLQECKQKQFLLPVLDMLCDELDIHDDPFKVSIMQSLLKANSGLSSDQYETDEVPVLCLGSLTSEEEADHVAMRMLETMDECQSCLLTVNIRSYHAERLFSAFSTSHRQVCETLL